MNHVDWTPEQIADYERAGHKKAISLDNRGPIQFASDGSLAPSIIKTYWKYGFYVLEGLIEPDELEDLRSDFQTVLNRAPAQRGSDLDKHGNPALASNIDREIYRFRKPLSDPNGGTSQNQSRYEVTMAEPDAPADAPENVICNVGCHLQLMDASLRLYGHPQLLTVASEINGPDFTPFTESIIIKQPGLGPSVAWHQDGTRRWDHPEWDQGTHGFNFMAQLYCSTAANGVWVIPGSHKLGKLDIRKIKAENGGTDRFADAVPMVASAGDVVMANRQVLHGSFANTSSDLRVTINFGFHRRSSVIGVKREDGAIYDEEHIRARSRIIALAIDARRQRFPEETSFVYSPLVDDPDDTTWNEQTREQLLKNYQLLDLPL